jgi:CRP/FNR family cyclic AMP-dependent transcriptional regulator
MAMTGRVEGAELKTDLQAFESLQNLDEESLEKLCRIGRCHDYPRGNVIHYRGDVDNTVCLVVRGKIKIVMTSEDGRDVAIDLLRAGDVFGLVAAVDGGGHPAHAITATEVRLLKCKSASFFNWVESQGMVEELVWKQLSSRVRHAYQRIGEHALMGVKERLLHTLLEIAEHEGEPAAEGDEVVFTRPTHRELAQRVGSSREVVTRVLKELLESDLLDAEGRVIRVPLSALVLLEG